MNTRTAKQLLSTLPLNVNDMARIVLEMSELLGKRVSGLSRLELLALMRRVICDGCRVLEQSESTISFAEAARASMEARRDRRPSTRRDLRHFIGRMLRVEGVASRPLRAMSVSECRMILERAFSKSPSSYRKGRAILSSIFTYGIRHEWCDRNPVQAIETPRIIEKSIRPLSLEEVSRLERTAERPEYKDMQLSLKLMLYCGVRPSEVCRLNPSQDIVGDELIIRSQTSKTGGGRVVPLRKLARFVRMHRELLVIPTHWERHWRALRRAARFRLWQPDVCRHTFAAYHARHFRNLPALQAEMGHSSLRLLYSRYLSPVDRESARRFWKA